MAAEREEDLLLEGRLLKLRKRREEGVEALEAVGASGVAGADGSSGWLATSSAYTKKSEIDARLFNDPLVAMRKRQLEARKQILENPQEMQRIRQRIESKKEKKVKKKKRARRRKRRRRRRSRRSTK